MIQKSRQWLSNHWHLPIGWLIAGLFFAALYLYKIGSFVPGHSRFETLDFLEINGLGPLFDSAAYLPMRGLELVMVQIDHPNATLLRLVSVLVVGGATISMYLVLSAWHTRRIALLMSILFMTNTYVLQAGRFASHESLLFLLAPLLLLFGIWLKAKRTVNRAPLILLGVSGLLYIPGFIWLMLGFLAAFHVRLKLAWKFVTQKIRITAAGGALLVLSPMIVSLINNPAQLPTLLGFDRLTNFGIRSCLEALTQIPDDLFVYGPSDASIWLLRTPILDIGSAVLLVLGIYSYSRGKHTLRRRLLIALFCVGVVLVTLSTYISVAVLLPIIYIVMASGLTYLLQSWFTVFPRNPLARAIGVVVLCGLIGVIAAYHINRYFVAWPHAPQTIPALLEQR